MPTAGTNVKITSATRAKFNALATKDDNTIYFVTEVDGSRVLYLGNVLISEGLLDGKQNTLVSGANLKTINGVSLLGSGDLPIGGGAPEVYGHTSPSIEVKATPSEDYVTVSANIKYFSSDRPDGYDMDGELEYNLANTRQGGMHEYSGLMVSSATIGDIAVGKVNRHVVDKKGVANGFASLGSDGKVPAAQLPASEGLKYAEFEVTPGTNTYTLPAEYRDFKLISIKVYDAAVTIESTITLQNQSYTNFIFGDSMFGDGINPGVNPVGYCVYNKNTGLITMSDLQTGNHPIIREIGVVY